ncbi:hypothetical protein V6N12_019982 [Hibiscus sabdariffa]|uniref:Uncharacterized protein n=1 Tax=Hibiscus sabdariffa TaxID=183260 RepID=A0ABR2BGV5_9ROSI
MGEVVRVTGDLILTLLDRCGWGYGKRRQSICRENSCFTLYFFMGCKITADAMAKVGFSLPPGLLYYARPPEQISRLLIGDTAGLLYPEAYATRCKKLIPFENSTKINLGLN